MVNPTKHLSVCTIFLQLLYYESNLPHVYITICVRVFYSYDTIELYLPHVDNVYMSCAVDWTVITNHSFKLWNLFSKLLIKVQLLLFLNSMQQVQRNPCENESVEQAVRWPGVPKVARSHLSQCSKSCDLQPSLNCAICRAQGVLPCVGWGVRPVNWIYRLWRHCP